MRTFKSILLAFVMMTALFALNTTDTQAQTAGTTVQSGQQSTNVGLLLPAVQKVREAARSYGERAVAQADRWMRATNFRLMPDGNFVPHFPTGGTNGNTGGSGTGGSATDKVAVNCVQIECPGSFDDNVTCWKCQ